jgi:SAM-dependent methyltransferase
VLSARWESAASRVAKRVLPASVCRAIARRFSSVPLGQVNMGDLARTRPVGEHFGFDRGTPVDRHYIESFLAAHASCIRGRVLEIGDDGYSRRFGRGITQQDVLHVTPDHPGATIIGDLSQAGLLPDASFDCQIITQTLQCIYDAAAAISHLKRSLAPDGVLLATLPGVSSVDRGEWKDSWFWSFSEPSARRLFEDQFGAANVEIGVHGNVYAATCFLHGLAAEEVDKGMLEDGDAAYPVVITIKARRDA